MIFINFGSLCQQPYQGVDAKFCESDAMTDEKQTLFSRTTLLFIVILAILSILVGGMLYLKIKFEHTTKAMLLESCKSDVQNLTYDYYQFGFYIDLLKISKRRFIHYASLGVELPKFMQFLYQMGISRGIELTEEEAKEVSDFALKALCYVSGENFGQDVDKWQQWRKKKDQK